MTQTVTPQSAKLRTPDWRTGAVAGIIGAVPYTLFIEGVTLATKGLDALFFPFRQIAAVVLGPRALEASYNLLVATAVGTLVHFAVAAVFGILLAFIASVSYLRAGTIVLGLLAGLAFYALNVFVVFPAAFPWFLANDRLTQSLGHALFGAVTGAWLAWRRAI